jgi:endonuclease III related protein
MHAGYGPQGWWPVRSERAPFRPGEGEAYARGYHPQEFGVPSTRTGRFEVVCGAVLTQNTAWRNVEHALDGLLALGVDGPERLLVTELGALRDAIRPAGYFNQKSGYLRETAAWFLEHDERLSSGKRTRVVVDTERPGLLAVRGVGPETADSILLYAYHLPTFVVDAYTKRVLGGLGLVERDASYEVLRQVCDEALRLRTEPSTVRAFQQAHALIVEHAKRLAAR